MKFKKVFVFLLILIYLMQGLALANSYEIAGFDGEGSHTKWEINLFFERIAEKFNLNFKFRQFDSYNAWLNFKKSLSRTSDLPDIFFKASLSPAEQIDLYENNITIDLSPYLKEHAPNFYNLMLNDEKILNSVKLPNNAIVSLPTLSITSPQNFMWINSEWLSTLGLEPPNTFEDLEKVLVAFKEQDPNKNGSADEIPLSFNGIWDLKFLSHAYGIIANDFNICLGSNNKVKFVPITDAYRLFILKLKELYSAKLLDNTGFSPSLELGLTNKDEKSVSKFGVFFAPSPMTKISSSQADSYTLLYPMKFDNKQIYRRLIENSISGSFAITSACKDPGKMLEWVDFLYTEDGGKLISVGKEGEDYKQYKDGKWDWMDASPDAMRNTIQNSTLVTSGFAPFRQAFDFQKLYDSEKNTQMMEYLNEYNQYLVSPMPNIFLNKEQEAYISKLQNNIATYVDTTLSRFILGELELNDNTWKDYIDNINNLGLNEFVNFWQDLINKQILK